MPRNGSGTYSLPQAPFVPNTVISSAAVNSDLSDIAAQLTNSLAADGQTTMTGPIKAATGTAANPSYTFGSATNMGFYNAGTNTIGVTINGTLVGTITSNGFSTPAGAPVFSAAQSRNSNQIHSTIGTNVTRQILQIGPCTFKGGDLLMANAFAVVFNSSSSPAATEAKGTFFISTDQTALAAAQNSDVIGGDIPANNKDDIPAGLEITIAAAGTAIVASDGTYYLTYAVTWGAGANNDLVISADLGINIVRIRTTLDTI